MEMMLAEAGRLLAATAAGAIIGLERELADKPAGFRTNIMICLGAALFTLVSAEMAGDSDRVDPTRIAAQIVTGVGFLGAGAIIQHRGNVVGLTTAATIWAVASVGMAFGAGEYELGALGTLLTTGVLFGLGAVEARIERYRSTATFVLEFDPHNGAQEVLRRTLKACGVKRRSTRMAKTAEGITYTMKVAGPPDSLNRLEHALLAEGAIRGLKRL